MGLSQWEELASHIHYSGNDNGGDHDVDLHTWDIYTKNSSSEYFC
jgi:hypothetical protein